MEFKKNITNGGRNSALHLTFSFSNKIFQQEYYLSFPSQFPFLINKFPTSENEIQAICLQRFLVSLNILNCVLQQLLLFLYFNRLYSIISFSFSFSLLIFMFKAKILHLNFIASLVFPLTLFGPKKTDKLCEIKNSHLKFCRG